MTHRRVGRAAMAVVSALGAAIPAFTAAGQCETLDPVLGRRFEVEVNAAIGFDLDGAGPRRDSLVIGGFSSSSDYQDISGVAVWDGVDWRAIGHGLNGRGRAFVKWDPDGDGPLKERLVATGAFTMSGATPVNRVAQWDGSVWQPIGAGFADNDGASLVVWDHDADPSTPARLVAGGFFTWSGTTMVNRIAVWDGESWHPLGDGFGATVRAVVAWNDDDDPATSARLVAAGDFTTSGAETINRIAMWDGSAWQSLGTGFSAAARALTVWDPDGTGPERSLLIAGGSFATAGGTAVNQIAAWNGAEWRALSTGVSSTGASPSVGGLLSWDHDESAATPDMLLARGVFDMAGGQPASGIAAWDSSAWGPVGTGLAGITFSLAYMTTWDPDGPGPRNSELVTGPGVLRWNGVRWDSFSTRLVRSSSDGQANALTAWDPDGSGPEPRQVVAGGGFTSAGSVAARFVARWDGAEWNAIGAGPPGSTIGIDTVRTATVWDPDGSGPEAERLVVGGSLIGSVSMWSGEAWNSVGTITGPGDCHALTSWDPDDHGPQTPVLVMGGQMVGVVGGLRYSGVLTWDGAQVSAPGQWPENSQGIVWSLGTWDADDAGPEPTRLIVGGSFISAAGTPAKGVAIWDGAAWAELGGGVAGADSVGVVLAITTWDHNGSGPGAPWLVVAGGFVRAGDVPALNVAAWDGSAWRALGGGVGDTVISFPFAATSWDLDGEGPLSPSLFVGGQFYLQGSSSIARWDGVAWSAINGAAAYQSTFALLTMPGDPALARAGQLIAGGRYTSDSSSFLRGGIAAWNGCIANDACPGDADGDMFVGLADLAAMIRNWSASEPPVPPLTRGDVTGDGLVTVKDVAVAIGNWGAACR